MNTLQTFSKRGLDIILSLLFCIVPLSYAWLYIPGIPVMLTDVVQNIAHTLREPIEYISEHSPRIGNIITTFLNNFTGFERIKVFLFVGLVLLASIYFLFLFKIKRGLIIPIGVFLGWSTLSYLVNQDINLYFLFGNGEKAHGWYFYLGLLMLGIILSSSGKQEKKKYLTLSLISGGIVCVYALFQKLGLDPIQSLYSSRLDETRIFSTLGNPNYLAGYVLMLMPLALFVTHSQKILGWGLFGFFALVLVWTKSLFGVGVFVGYLSYLILYRLAPLKQKTRHIIALCTVIFVIIVSGYIIIQYGDQIIEIQKIKGFIARYFLWETGIHAIFGDIRNTLFGYGPDGFLPISEIFRSPELSVFEDPKFRIDRSHNVWIDFLIHFGIPVGSLMIYWIFSGWKKLPLSHKEVLILFSIFFFFNIPVLVHFIFLLQILTFSEKHLS